LLVVVVVGSAVSSFRAQGMMVGAAVGFLRNFALNLNMFDASC
jgi:hypothetical protein